MSRRAYNAMAAMLPDLVLDLPLYDATMENMTDRCGHRIYNFGRGMDCETAEYEGFQGVRMKGSGECPYWEFEPVSDSGFTFSFYCQNMGVSGHGWCWALFDEENEKYINATSYGGSQSYYFSQTYGAGVRIPWGMQYEVRHFTCVCTPEQLSVYINGLLYGSVAGNFTESFCRAGFRQQVLADKGNSSDAIFRQYKLFRRALSAEEVAALYEAERARLNEV